MTKNEQLIAYMLNKINREFAADIDLLLLYGSAANGTATDKSDLDLFFIPRTQRGYKLGETFILDEIGYDFFGIPWSRVESIANLEESLAPLVGDATILFSYSPTEQTRFHNLQQLLQKRLNDAPYMQMRAQEKVKSAIEHYQTMMNTDPIGKTRKTAGYIMMALAEAVAYANQTYFHRGLKTQYADLRTLKQQPRDFLQLYRNIIIEADAKQIMHYCRKMIDSMLAFLNMKKAVFFKAVALETAEKEQTVSKRADYVAAASWYEELSATFTKIYLCVENQNYILAFLSACCLQDSLEKDLSIKLKTTDLLSAYQFDNLAALAIRAKEIEQQCIQEIEANGGVIRDLGSIDELLL